MKIIAVVKFNNGEAFVLDKIPEPIHIKYGSDTIIGKRGCFYTCYGYEECSGGWEAFAGREFDLNLSDGTVEHCYGQWWDMVTGRAKKELEINNEDKVLVNVTANDIDELTECYVYYGFRAIASEVVELRKQYTGKVYGCREYEDEVIKPIRKKAKDEYLISITERIFKAGFREVGKRKYKQLNGRILKFTDINYGLVGCKHCKNIGELDIPQDDKDILSSAFNETVRSCCVKSDGEVYIRNDKSINYLYQSGIYF